jgi:hypothetical protein
LKYLLELTESFLQLVEYFPELVKLLLQLME